ncbi:hypothetical protein JNB63_02170 [Microbacterium trichothecenolyticum]|uniref:hypothetical protein n=1 Tax=Microbacterium trichothecenolyticum TaxID=69370 RepID=UPI001C6DDDC9|nr:hypothetical protein [Microbacterium trichothecenolyticum]MBW9118892.1 hypothetical protein [Microbacterium trichothecenolyticum]
MDISPLNLRGQLRKAVPQGPAAEDDATLIATGSVYEVDSAAGLVRVGLRGGDVWLPAVAGRYSFGVLVRVLLDATSARPVAVLGTVNPAAPFVLGLVTAGPTAGVLTVTIEETSYDVPAPTGAYVVGESAWIALDDWGTPILAIGPNSSLDSGGSSGGGAPGGGGSTVPASATIGPQVTGTWRSAVSRWDSWNPGRYGLGSTPIYQGDNFGSGPLVGFAGYGDQIVNLGAVSIVDITMQAKKGADGLSASLVVQGSASGSRPGGAPSSSGDTAATGSIGSGKTGSLTFTAAMREAFRTGASKGLVAVGSDYGGFGGFGVPPSFVLQISYTKTA